MPVVKRFRPLGQVRLVRHEPRLVTENKSYVTEEQNPTAAKVISRFQPLSDHKRRADRKHRYPLRTDTVLWDRIWEMSLNCGGSGSGASLNVILNKLIAYALDDQSIIKRIAEEFPVRSEFIKIRSWRRY